MVSFYSCQQWAQYNQINVWMNTILVIFVSFLWVGGISVGVVNRSLNGSFFWLMSSSCLFSGLVSFGFRPTLVVYTRAAELIIGEGCFPGIPLRLSHFGILFWFLFYFSSPGEHLGCVGLSVLRHVRFKFLGVFLFQKFRWVYAPYRHFAVSCFLWNSLAE